jgi:acetyl-CoA carboxylase biotin carboxyl carrier protein
MPAAKDAATGAPVASGADVVSAPMAGTFYRAPAPGEQPFVEVGARVQAGDVLCIIESMKMMNRIESDRAGEVLAVLVDNGQPIGTGAALFRVA